MPTSPASLPVLPADGPLRLTPTDVSQFVRLEQCERYLRFRLAERAGQKFMEEYGVIPQRITPLLSLSGSTFEQGVEADLGHRFRTVQYAAKYALDHNRPANNAEVVAEAKKLAPGQSVLLFQPRLEAELHGWRLRGDVDLLRRQHRARVLGAPAYRLARSLQFASGAFRERFGPEPGEHVVGGPKLCASIRPARACTVW